MRLMIDVNEDDYRALHECVMILNRRWGGKTLELRIFAAVGNGKPVLHGKWIEKNSELNGTYYVCSQCGEPMCQFKKDFCASCGTGMKKEESAIRKRAELEMAESCYLEQGITQGIV